MLRFSAINGGVTEVPSNVMVLRLTLTPPFKAEHNARTCRWALALSLRGRERRIYHSTSTLTPLFKAELNKRQLPGFSLEPSANIPKTSTSQHMYVNTAFQGGVEMNCVL